MNLIKVLVVDDSAFMRKMISDMLNTNPRINVIGTARNGSEALAKITELSPDVVTLDVEMPVMDGISTLKEIMRQNPLPVIMLSSLTKQGADKTIQSMSLGAVDFIAKPSGSISLDINKIKNEIISKVVDAAKSQVHRLTEQYQTIEPISPIRVSKTGRSNEVVVAIGTSTGGPRALQQVLTRLPENFPAPIVIVQHMPKGFTKSLANRLDSLSQINVKEAENGQKLEKGTAYIAPGGFHLRVKNIANALFAKVSKEKPRNGHQPSVDVLFESVSELHSYQVYAVVMTGMGADGAQGLIEIKEKNKNAIIVSESQRTAIVYGMPQAAVKTNLVDHVTDLNKISEVLINKINA